MYQRTIDLLFDWFGLVCFANKNKIFSCHTTDSKPVKQEVNGTVILPLLVFPDLAYAFSGRVLLLLWGIPLPIMLTSFENNSKLLCNLFVRMQFLRFVADANADVNYALESEDF